MNVRPLCMVVLLAAGYAQAQDPDEEYPAPPPDLPGDEPTTPPKKISEPTQRPVEELIRELESADDRESLNRAANDLRRLGPKGKPAWKLLLAATRKQALAIRPGAGGFSDANAELDTLHRLLGALRAVDPEPHATRLLELAKLPKSFVGWVMLREVFELETTSKSDRERVRVQLAGLLAHEHEAVRSHSLDSVVMLGEDATPLIPTLITMSSDDPAPMTRASALVALGDLALEPEQCVPALIESLKSDDLFMRWVAANSLGNFGKAATAAIPHLEAALKDTSKVVRRHAKRALEEIRKP